jgi:hypothetical protein
MHRNDDKTIVGVLLRCAVIVVWKLINSEH